MRTRRLRLLSAGLGLAALAALLPTSPAADAPAAPATVIKKSADADIAFLEKGLAKPKVPRNEVSTLKATAMLLAYYGQETKGMTGLRDEALKVAEAIGKKDFPGAKAAAGKLATAAGSDGKPVKLEAKHDLHDAMSVFRDGSKGGLNLQADIGAQAKKPDPAVTAVMAGRLVATAYYTKLLPGEAVDSPAKKKQWEDWSDEMGKLAAEIGTESEKGPKADKPAITKKLNALAANCGACHTAFKGK